MAGALPLFLGVLLNDFAYASTFEVQWKNFASWLLVGALVLGLPLAVWATADSVRLPDDRGPRRLGYVAALVASWILGFVNALVHAGDAWASMPGGLVISGIVAVLMIVAVWLGFAGRPSNYRSGVSA